MAVKSSFSAGEVLLAADLTDTFADKNNNKNLLYNGAMQVAQRGTSTTGITGGGYSTVDRWQKFLDTLGTWTETVENDAPTGSGLRKSLKVLCTTADAAPAAADFFIMSQRLEGQDLQRIAKGTSSAQQLTLSFWVKSNVTGSYVVGLEDVDNSRYVGATYSVSASATWEKKTITFPADTTGAFDNDNANSLTLLFFLGAGSNRTSGTLNTTWASTVTANQAVGQTNLAAATNNYWQITGVQLEVGPTGTGFEFKSYGRELAECQRYYYRLADTGNSQTVLACHYYSSTQVNAIPQFPVTMRTGPSLHAASGTDFYNIERNSGEDKVNAWTISSATPYAARIYNNTEASGTAGHGGWFYTANSSSFLAFSAEL